MSGDINPENVAAIVSIIALIISVITVLQINKQIKTSNQQVLFNKRLNIYLDIERMINNYKQFISVSVVLPYDGKTIDYYTAVLLFQRAVVNQFNIVYYDEKELDFEEIRKKIRNLHLISKEFNFLFNPSLKDIGDFVESYVKLLDDATNYMQTSNFTKDIDRDKEVTYGSSDAILLHSESMHDTRLRNSIIKTEEAYEKIKNNDINKVFHSEISLLS